MIDWCRALVTGILIIFVGVVLGLSLASRLAPLVDRELFAIRGASMGPDLPVGSLVVVSRTRHAEPGTIVTYRTPAGTAVTHRAIRTAETSSGTFVETRGDANPSADPTLVPADDVVGVAVLSVPALGYLLGLLAMPMGMAAIASTAATLVALLLALDELAAHARTGLRAPRRSVVQLS